MNPARSNTAFEDYVMPTHVASPTRSSIKMMDDFDDLLPLHNNSPMKLNVDRMIISSSLLRKIEYELKHDQCDPRTVLNFCRGLKRGSLEFDETYTAARIRSYAKNQRIVTDSNLSSYSNTGVLPPNICQHPNDWQDSDAYHPMAVNHLGHLMSHFGIWVGGLLGIQFFAAWHLSALADEYLLGGRNFYLAVGVFLMLAIDSIIWFRRRGQHSNVFFAPGIALYVMALLPILILHVMASTKA